MVSTLIAQYGYLAVFLGTFLEGETILLAAGFAVHRGLLDGLPVFSLAFAGAALGDQVGFFLGHWRGAALIARFPSLARHAPRIQELLLRHDTLFILGNRFLYGLRIAGPVLIGASGVAPRRFVVLNLIGAAIWAAIIMAAGYAFGAVLTSLLEDIKRFEEILLLGILATGFLYWLWRRKHD